MLSLLTNSLFHPNYLNNQAPDLLRHHIVETGGICRRADRRAFDGGVTRVFFNSSEIITG